MRSKAKGERAVGVEHLDAVVAMVEYKRIWRFQGGRPRAVVVVVGYGDLPGRADGDAARPVKLPVSRAARSKAKGERAVGVEHLDAVVSGVGHGDLPGRADGDAEGAAKFSVARAVGTEPKGEGAVGAEDVD